MKAERVAVPVPVRTLETLGEPVAVAEIDGERDALEERESVVPAVTLRNEVNDLTPEAVVEREMAAERDADTEPVPLELSVSVVFAVVERTLDADREGLRDAESLIFAVTEGALDMVEEVVTFALADVIDIGVERLDADGDGVADSVAMEFVPVALEKAE